MCICVCVCIICVYIKICVYAQIHACIHQSTLFSQRAQTKGRAIVERQLGEAQAAQGADVAAIHFLNGGFLWIFMADLSNIIQLYPVHPTLNTHGLIENIFCSCFVFKLRSRSANSAVRTSWFEPKPRCMDTLNSRNVAIHIETNISV